MSKQRVLITAGATGIGREIARAFVESGASVFVCDINRIALANIAEEIPGVLTGHCDMSSRSHIERMVPEAAAALGGIDVLVNNAGIAGPTAPTDEVDPDDWDAVLQVNLTGTFNTTRLAIPHLKTAGRGAIITLSSMAGRFGYRNRSPYCASKWALIGFTKTLALELGAFNITANAILPGAVQGERLDKVYAGRAALSGKSIEEVRREALASQSIKQLVDPRDIAALAVFLASDAAKSISGQALPIDNDRQQA